MIIITAATTDIIVTVTVGISFTKKSTRYSMIKIANPMNVKTLYLFIALFSFAMFITGVSYANAIP